MILNSQKHFDERKCETGKMPKITQINSSKTSNMEHKVCKETTLHLNFVNFAEEILSTFLHLNFVPIIALNFNYILQPKVKSSKIFFFSNQLLKFKLKYVYIR